MRNTDANNGPVQVAATLRTIAMLDQPLNDLTDAEVTELLSDYDRTEPALQRRITLKFAHDLIHICTALKESVNLQAHYASLLNNYDQGHRTIFTSAQEWIDRLAELNDIPKGIIVL